MLIKNLKPFGPNKEENIQRVEKGEKVKFPADYREFLLTVGGGIFPQVRNPDAGPEDNVLYNTKPLGYSYISNGKRVLDRFEVLFGCLRDGNSKYDIESQLWVWDADESDYENPDKMIPIGQTQFGNTLILLLNQKEYGNIGYWDHQELIDDPNDEHGLTIIMNSFSELVEAMNDETVESDDERE